MGWICRTYGGEETCVKQVVEKRQAKSPEHHEDQIYWDNGLSKGCHLDMVRGPSTPHDPESGAGGSLSSWQGHPSR
jgi:hypothetical protein